MTLQELLTRHSQRPAQSVPDWMLGFYKRHAISFANGISDLHTHVCWLQSRNFTIDLRLPLAADQVPVKPLAGYTAAELQVLANYEGWKAQSDWDGTALSWRPTEVTLQLHNRWPEPAILKRIGNCMVEFCPSDAYVEDWRLQPSPPGPLIGLQLVEERDVASGKVRHTGGGLIVCGDYAALVLGRNSAIATGNAVPLKVLVAQAGNDVARLQQLLNFETSVAKGSLATGYKITLSTQPARIGKQLFPLEGFEYLAATQGVRQSLEIEGVLVERTFTIDTLEPNVSFDLTTGFAPAAAKWYEMESPTLTRYAKVLG
jgi:hypothetical protein